MHVTTEIKHSSSVSRLPRNCYHQTFPGYMYGCNCIDVIHRYVCGGYMHGCNRNHVVAAYMDATAFVWWVHLWMQSCCL